MNEVFFLEECFFASTAEFCPMESCQVFCCHHYIFPFPQNSKKNPVKVPLCLTYILYAIHISRYLQIIAWNFFLSRFNRLQPVGRLIQIWANQFKKNPTELLVCLTKTKKMLGLFSVRIFCIIWANFCCCGIHLTLSVHECRVSDSVRQKRNLLHQVSKIIGLGMIGSSIVSSRVRLPPSCQILYKKYFLKLKAKNGTS